MLQPGCSKISGWAYIRCMRQLHHPFHTSSNQETGFASGSTNTGSQSLAWRDLMSWSWLPHCNQSRWDHHLGASFLCLFWSLGWIPIYVSEFLLINQYCAVDSSTVSIYFIRDPLREFIIRSSSYFSRGKLETQTWEKSLIHGYYTDPERLDQSPSPEKETHPENVTRARGTDNVSPNLEPEKSPQIQKPEPKRMY